MSVQYDLRPIVDGANALAAIAGTAKLVGGSIGVGSMTNVITVVGEGYAINSTATGARVLSARNGAILDQTATALPAEFKR